MTTLPEFSLTTSIEVSSDMTPHEPQGAGRDFAVLDTCNWDMRTPVGGGSSVATPPSRGARVGWKSRATRATIAMGHKVGNKSKGAGGRGVVVSMAVVGSDVDEGNDTGAGDFRASAGVVGLENQEEEEDVAVVVAPVDHANEGIGTRSSSSFSSSSCSSKFGPPLAPSTSPPASFACKLPAGDVRRPLRFSGMLEVSSSSVVRDTRARHRRRSPGGETQDHGQPLRGCANARTASSSSASRRGGKEEAAKVREEEEEEEEEKKKKKRKVMVAEKDMTPVGKMHRAARTPPTRSKTTSTRRARDVQLHS